MTILHEINDGPGFCLEELAPAELELVRGDHHRAVPQADRRVAAGTRHAEHGNAGSPATTRCRSRSTTASPGRSSRDCWTRSTSSDFSRMGFFRRIRRAGRPERRHQPRRTELAAWSGPTNRAMSAPSTPTSGSGMPATATVRCRRGSTGSRSGWRSTPNPGRTDCA